MTDNDTTKTDLAYADTLWKSADALRGQVDAAEYKHVVLGLLFLKYISDSFEARREELKVELGADGITGKQLESLLENRDEYTAERVFWVPPEARWTNLQNQATRADIATLIDDAILAVERDNPNLKGKLPRDYARRGIEPVKLKGLIDLIANVGFKGGRTKARDTLGRVYEYFLGKFAQAVIFCCLRSGLHPPDVNVDFISDDYVRSISARLSEFAPSRCGNSTRISVFKLGEKPNVAFRDMETYTVILALSPLASRQSDFFAGSASDGDSRGCRSLFDTCLLAPGGRDKGRGPDTVVRA
jgi:hypothetical protein